MTNLRSEAIALLQERAICDQNGAALMQALRYWQDGDTAQALALLETECVRHPTDGLVLSLIHI